MQQRETHNEMSFFFLQVYSSIWRIIETHIHKYIHSNSTPSYTLSHLIKHYDCQLCYFGC